MGLILWLNLLAGPALLAAEPLGPLPPPGLYARLVEPSEYPAYRQRAFAVPTWQTFGGRPQMVGGRYVKFGDPCPPEQLDQLPALDAVFTGRGWLQGRVFQPNIGILAARAPDFTAALGRLRDNGMYLFNVGGYGPGSALKGSYGQVQVTDAQRQALESVLGDRWLGFDLGEQDGRYHNSFASRQLPAPRDRVGQHRAFRDWCDGVIDDQGGRLSLLTTLWGWHYPTQDGAMTLIGAESECKCGITAPQVQYAFLRGAGKQYGVLWFGNTALFSTFGVSSWGLDEHDALTGQAHGSSASLMRRLFVSQWLWNSCILSYENNTLAWNKPRTRCRVSPIGRVQLGVERLIQQGVTPGVQQTPVAILQDYFSGWMPARTNVTTFHTFNGEPYGPGEHLTDALISLLFPGYENAGWYMDESGGVCPTPYGDIADCLLTDAPAEVLARYGLVLVSGVRHDLAGVRQRLDDYCAAGGALLAVGDDAARLWPEYCQPTTVAVPAGTEVRWQTDGRVDREERAFDLHEAADAPGIQVLATCQGRPAVVRVAHRGGTLVLLLASTGLNGAPLACAPGRNPYSNHGENTPLERPYRLLAHTARAYDAALSAQRLFSAGDGLTVTTGRRPDGTFVVGVANPGLRSRPFALVSHLGPVKSVTELDLGSPIADLPGYWPTRSGPMLWQPTPHRDYLDEITGEATPSDAQHIAGGDIRVFEVTLQSCAARPRPDLPLPAAPRDRLLLVPDLVTLRERLLAWPRFGCCFDGVAVSAPALLDTDAAWLSRHAGWFRRHGLRLLVDARDADAALAAERLAAWGPGAELLAAARPAGLPATVTWRRPDEVRWLRAGAAAERGAGGLQVLAGDWRSWDGLYRDVRAAWLDPAPGRVVGPGELAPPASVPRARLRRYVALHGIGSLPAAVAERPGLRERFDGLLLDSAWLLARSDTALARERAWLADADLRVVLDFTRAINRFPGLTFSSGVRHAQAASQRAFEAALAKMTALGARDALICSHAAEGDWDDQRQGLERFLDAAAARGITVHWRPSETRPPGKLAAHAALVAELRRAHPNLRIAAPLVEEPDAAKLSRSLAPAGAPELWLLAAPEPHEGRLGVQFLPLTGLAKADAARALAAAAGATVVFDADYLAWKEVLADVEYVR